MELNKIFKQIEEHIKLSIGDIKSIREDIKYLEGYIKLIEAENEDLKMRLEAKELIN